jgi:voltage-gated potassium channel
MQQKGGSPTGGARGDLPGLARTYWRHRYTILFYTLIVTMVGGSTDFQHPNFNGTLIESLFSACLLAAILPVGAVRNRPYLLMAIVVVWLARMVTPWLDHRVLSEMALGIWTLIGLLAAVAAIHFAIGATQVDAEHLYAALSAYLLAGTYFGLSYWFLNR